MTLKCEKLEDQNEKTMVLFDIVLAIRVLLQPNSVISYTRAKSNKLGNKKGNGGIENIRNPGLPD
jgi:hypothetical protein